MKIKAGLCMIILLLSCADKLLAQRSGIIKYYAQSGRLALSSPPNPNGYPYQYETEEGVLYFNNSESLYQQLQNPTITQVRVGPEGTERIQVPRTNLDSQGWVYRKNIETKQLICREAFWNKANFVVVQETLPKINWVMGYEKKKVGKYMCQRAEADFAGRHWIAWFSIEIPISVGPWKLWGLPGAILEAYDSKHDFQYLLKELEIPFQGAANKISGTDLQPGKAITREEYKRRNAEKKDKYVKYMKTLAEKNGGQVKTQFYPELEVN